MPLLQAAYERDGDRVGFLGVNTEDTPSAAASLLADLDVTYASVVDRDKQLLTGLGAPGLPVTLAELDALGSFEDATATGYETLLGNLADNLAGCLEKL